jgi:protein TonB
MGALLASLVLHWLIFSQDPAQEQVVQLAGGAQQLPIAVNFSVAAVAQSAPSEPVPPKPEPPPPEQVKPKQPLKEVVKATKTPLLEKAVDSQPLQEVAEIVERDVEVEHDTTETPAQQEQLAAQAATTAQQPPGLESIPVVREVSYRQAPQPPVYPKTALRRKQQGEVLVQALVSEEGNTEQVEVVRSSGVASLDASALKAVSGWVFEAAKMDGRPIRAWIEVPVAFELRR